MAYLILFHKILFNLFSFVIQLLKQKYDVSIINEVSINFAAITVTIADDATN